MNALCIADLMDGRRALIRTGSDRCEVVTILSESDMKPKPWWYANITTDACEGLAVFEGDRFVGFIQTTQPLQIPPPPPKRRITAEDLIQRAREADQTAGRPRLTPEEQSLHEINRLRGDGPDGSSPV